MSRFFKVLYKLDEKIEEQELKKSFSIFIAKAKLVHNLHRELNEEFRPSVDLFESCLNGAEYIQRIRGNIGDIIMSKKHKFFMYAPFITQCLNMTRLLKDMKNNGSLKNEIEKLEKSMIDDMNQTGNKNHPIAIESLLMFPFQHILR